jgi:molybdopterin-guanine dinucleotide biosynthesis protein A
MIADCTAIILAGGESKRMGRDKAALPFNGETLLQSVIDSVQPLFAQTLVSVRELRSDVVLPQICDTQADGGPLVGLISAMEAVTTPWTFVVACDMPFVAPALIAHLASLRDGHQAVVPQVNEHAQPLAAFYARSALPLLRSSLASGNKSLIGALKSLDVRYVGADELLQWDAQLRSFFDLDTPQDVAIAEGMK